MEKTVQIYITPQIPTGHISPVNYAANCPEKPGLLNLADQMEKDETPWYWIRRQPLQGDAL